MSSMRSVGYSIQTAVADIVDNSISAGATNIEISFASVPSPHMSITDNGWGMKQSEAREAMRLAGQSATADRNATDLGRFGLGLKTASLSQARCLTIISKTLQTGLVAYQWNLDVIENSGRWTLLSPNPNLPNWNRAGATLEQYPSGTIVLWEELDLLHAQWGTAPSDLDNAMAAVRQHLGLVFHRFIDGDDAPKVEIAINGTKIMSSDPFLSRHRATQSTGEDRIRIRNEIVKVTGYTLPALNKLKKSEYDKILSAGTPSESQGFYIYRAKRLVTWGTWFRLAPKSNMKRLTRIKVDVPNALDDMWSLDVKKSQAVPPPEVRDRLRRMATNFATPSERVHNYRGRTTKSADINHIWQLTENEDRFWYSINREHPLILALSQGLEETQLQRLTALIKATEASMPIDDIHNRLSKDRINKNSDVSNDDLVAIARAIFDTLPNGSVDLLTTVLHTTEPFAGRNDIDTLAVAATVDVRTQN